MTAETSSDERRATSEWRDQADDTWARGQSWQHPGNDVFPPKSWTWIHPASSSDLDRALAPPVHRKHEGGNMPKPTTNPKWRKFKTYNQDNLNKGGLHSKGRGSYRRETQGIRHTSKENLSLDPDSNRRTVHNAAIPQEIRKRTS